jgi:hypothetical protein
LNPVPKPVKEVKKIKKTERGLSDSHLLKLRRAAVHVVFKDCCFFCGKHKSQTELEDHHIVKRHMFLLRYAWRNGILVCKYGCHQHGETPEGKHKIDEYIAPFRNYLQDRSGNCKDWLLSHSMTKLEYKRQMFNELKEIIMFGLELP